MSLEIRKRCKNKLFSTAIILILAASCCIEKLEIDGAIHGAEASSRATYLSFGARVATIIVSAAQHLAACKPPAPLLIHLFNLSWYCVCYGHPWTKSGSGDLKRHDLSH
jgi:hypothetical protein